MKTRIDYRKFVKNYPKIYQSAVYYPVYLSMKNEGFNFRKIKHALISKIPQSTIYFWYSGKVPLPFKEYSTIKEEFNRSDLEQIAIIIGHIFGDGGIDSKKFLHYCNTEEFLINEFQNAMKKALNIDPFYKKKESTGIIRLRYPRLASRILISLFGEFSLGKDNKKITTKIRRMPLWWKRLLVRSFYDDDGSVPLSNKYKAISLKQKNKKLLMFVKDVFSGLNINSFLTRDGDKWILRIMKRSDIIKFRDKIGFSDGYRKQKSLEGIIELIRFPHWNTKEKIMKMPASGPKTRKELVDSLNLESGTVYGHLHGWKRKDKNRKNTKGLIDIGLVGIRKNGKVNIYETV